jgi:UTP--glucose-1-phosphate uridylyltransferase
MKALRIKKVVFPVGGLGTRFLPATKASPKEMLPVVDKPLIQYAAEEAVAAGAEVLIFVTGRNKNAILDHFDKAYELEAELQARGKTRVLQVVRSVVPSHVSCVYIRQPEALGLGHAVLCARPVVNEDPFAVILADDLIDAGDEPGCLTQMVRQYERNGCSIVGVEEVAPKETDKYGIVAVDRLSKRLSRVSGIVEKPKPGTAPSTLAVVGRYVLTPRIFGLLEATGQGAGGEIQLTDAIAALLRDEEILAYQFVGRRYDCGDRLGYLKATVEYGLKHPELRRAFADYLRTFVAGSEVMNQPPVKVAGST